MLRKVILSLLLLTSTAALAANADRAVDDVLKAKAGGISEEQLDETAAKMISDDTTKAKKSEILIKPLSEDQIPVFRNEKSAKSSASSNWYRVIGSLIFVLAVTGVMVVVVKKSAKTKNVASKKAKIEILHQHFLGPKKSVALIQVAGEAILIGVTDQNINMIKPVALIDDELVGEQQDFNGFLEDEFTLEQLTAQKSRTRTV